MHLLTYLIGGSLCEYANNLDSSGNIRNNYGAMYETRRVEELPTFWEFVQWFLLRPEVQEKEIKAG